MDSSSPSSPAGSTGGGGGGGALHQLLSPDGYYTYLGIPKPTGGTTPTSSNYSSFLSSSSSTSTTKTLDEDLIKKNYRKLSLKHHPDRRGGDSDTFKALSRAKKVLLTEKLRKGYDLLGLDLEEDEEETADDDHDHHGSSADTDGDTGEDAGEDESVDNHDAAGGGEKKNGSSSSKEQQPDSVMSHIASATLATILQMMVRTTMMGMVSVFLSRYLITVVLVGGLLAFVVLRMKQGGSGGKREMGAMGLIFVGVLFMYKGSWFFFWIGETMVMSIFLINSFAITNKTALLAIIISSSILSSILQGKFWRYTFVIGMESGLALLAVLIFPVLEMVLEEVMNEKLRKVGEKIRAHSKRVELELELRYEKALVEATKRAAAAQQQASGGGGGRGAGVLGKQQQRGAGSGGRGMQLD